MSVFFISDTHFHHQNIIKYCNRPFKNFEEMDDVIINNWNSIVSETDLVIHGGDFALGHLIVQQDLLKRLNGRKILIQGNHDRSIKKMLEVGFQRVYKYMSLKTKYGKLLIAHNPTFFLNENNEYHDIFLYGHIHDKELQTHLPENMKSINISVEKINYTPRSLKELIEKF